MQQMLQASPYFNPTVYDKRCVLIASGLACLVLLGIIIGTSASGRGSTSSLFIVVPVIALIAYLIVTTSIRRRRIKERPRMI